MLRWYEAAGKTRLLGYPLFSRGGTQACPSVTRMAMLMDVLVGWPPNLSSSEVPDCKSVVFASSISLVIAFSRCFTPKVK